MMTPDAASWGEIEEFCNIDGWTPTRTTSHVFYEKVLDDRDVLQCHISHARDNVPSPGRFGAVLRYQPKVTRAQFWECVRSGQPVKRPAPVEEVVVQHAAWVVRVLKQDLHLSDEEIAALSEGEAVRRAQEFWASGSS